MDALINVVTQTGLLPLFISTCRNEIQALTITIIKIPFMLILLLRYPVMRIPR